MKGIQCWWIVLLIMCTCLVKNDRTFLEEIFWYWTHIFASVCVCVRITIFFVHVGRFSHYIWFLADSRGKLELILVWSWSQTLRPADRKNLKLFNSPLLSNVSIIRALKTCYKETEMFGKKSAELMDTNHVQIIIVAFIQNGQRFYKWVSRPSERITP